MAAHILSRLKGQTDENGSLLIASIAPGTDGPKGPLFHVVATITSALPTKAYLNIGEKAEDATRSNFEPFANIIGRSDGANLLIGILAAPGASPGPRTPLGNLRVKTDGQGYLICAQVAAGSVLGPIRPLGELLCRIDETGGLRIATGP